MEIFRGACVEDATLAPIVAALTALGTASWAEGAAEWCELLLNQMSVGGSPLSQALTKVLRAATDLRCGDLVSAKTHAQQSLTILPPRSWGVFLGLPLGSVITAVPGWDTTMRRRSSCVPRCPRPCSRPLADCGTSWRVVAIITRPDIPTPRPTTSRLPGRLAARWGLDEPALVQWRSDLAYALLALGREAEARTLVEKQLARIRPGDSRMRGISLRAAAAMSEPRKRPALLREAVDALRETTDRYELTLAYADLSAAYDALGHHARARTVTSRAERLAGQCGAEELRETLALVGELGPPERQQGDTRLSDAELRVAALAVDGYTNRQISTKLCVSVSTVEQHLTRIYRKLDVTRRADLASALSL